MILLRIFLLPFSLLYGIITYIRNKFYDWRLIPSTRYENIYVISVGNITVGGTGKTPFVEYLVRSFLPHHRVAILSRGYKRTTKGFMFVENDSAPSEAGDEPYQIKQKFPGIVVAVDADRVKGITKICETHPDIRIIILDDAFQYRKIRPNLSILLADYSRPLYHDGMLPGGRLREWPFFAKRADMMVITKSPAGISSEKQQNIVKRYARIFPKDMFFAAIGYGDPMPVFQNAGSLSTDALKQYDVLLLTGIANPKPLETYIRQYAASVHSLKYPDHHSFQEKDIANISKQWNAIQSTNKILITTEKDAVRLKQTELSETIAKYCFYIPIEIDLLGSGKSAFEQKLMGAYAVHL